MDPVLRDKAAQNYFRSHAKEFAATLAALGRDEEAMAKRQQLLADWKIAMPGTVDPWADVGASMLSGAAKTLPGQAGLGVRNLVGALRGAAPVKASDYGYEPRTGAGRAAAMATTLLGESAIPGGATVKGASLGLNAARAGIAGTGQGMVRSWLTDKNEQREPSAGRMLAAGATEGALAAGGTAAISKALGLLGRKVARVPKGAEAEAPAAPGAPKAPPEPPPVSGEAYKSGRTWYHSAAAHEKPRDPPPGGDPAGNWFWGKRAAWQWTGPKKPAAPPGAESSPGAGASSREGAAGQSPWWEEFNANAQFRRGERAYDPTGTRRPDWTPSGENAASGKWEHDRQSGMWGWQRNAAPPPGSAGGSPGGETGSAPPPPPRGAAPEPEAGNAPPRSGSPGEGPAPPGGRGPEQEPSAGSPGSGAGSEEGPAGQPGGPSGGAPGAGQAPPGGTPYQVGGFWFHPNARGERPSAPPPGQDASAGDWFWVRRDAAGQRGSTGEETWSWFGRPEPTSGESSGAPPPPPGGSAGSSGSTAGRSSSGAGSSAPPPNRAYRQGRMWFHPNGRSERPTEPPPGKTADDGSWEWASSQRWWWRGSDFRPWGNDPAGSRGSAGSRGPGSSSSPGGGSSGADPFTGSFWQRHWNAAKAAGKAEVRDPSGARRPDWVPTGQTATEGDWVHSAQYKKWYWRPRPSPTGSSGGTSGSTSGSAPGSWELPGAGKRLTLSWFKEQGQTPSQMFKMLENERGWASYEKAATDSRAGTARLSATELAQARAFRARILAKVKQWREEGRSDADIIRVLAEKGALALPFFVPLGELRSKKQSSETTGSQRMAHLPGPPA